jgi:hypothetical protein
MRDPQFVENPCLLLGRHKAVIASDCFGTSCMNFRKRPNGSNQPILDDGSGVKGIAFSTPATDSLPTFNLLICSLQSGQSPQQVERQLCGSNFSNPSTREWPGAVVRNFNVTVYKRHIPVLAIGDLPAPNRPLIAAFHFQRCAPFI